VLRYRQHKPNGQVSGVWGQSHQGGNAACISKHYLPAFSP